MKSQPLPTVTGETIVLKAVQCVLSEEAGSNPSDIRSTFLA